jgi:hypothetical protein
LFYYDMHIVTVMNFEFFSESRQMEAATWLTHRYTSIRVTDL